MSTADNIQRIATLASEAMETATRPSGEEFRKFKEGSPEWMTDIARAAHDDSGILPDDYRYRFMEETLDQIAEWGDFANVDEIREALDEIEADVYTSDLTAWLGSMASRAWRDAPSSRARMSCCAVNIPRSDPIGLKDWERFRRRVEVSSGPIDRMYGLALVSRKDRPQGRMQ